MDSHGIVGTPCVVLQLSGLEPDGRPRSVTLLGQDAMRFRERMELLASLSPDDLLREEMRRLAVTPADMAADIGEAA
jgi:hypothetical protein